MNTQHSPARTHQVNHGISLTLFMLNTPLTEGQHLRVAVSHTEILLTVHSRRIWGSNVTANTIPGFTRNSPPLWARGQDAFLVIYGVRVQVPTSCTQWNYVKALQSFTVLSCIFLVVCPLNTVLSSWFVLWIILLSYCVGSSFKVVIWGPQRNCKNGIQNVRITTIKLHCKHNYRM